MANASPFGLASYFYSRDLGRVWRVAEALESGNGGRQYRSQSPRKWRRSAGSRNPGSAAKVRTTASRSMSRIKYIMMAGHLSVSSRRPPLGHREETSYATCLDQADDDVRVASIGMSPRVAAR